MENTQINASHDSKKYIDQIDAKIRERITQECALEVLEEVMVQGTISDLDEVKSRYRLTMDSCDGRELLNRLLEESCLDNVRWLVTHFFGNINAPDNRGRTVLMDRVFERYTYRRRHVSTDASKEQAFIKLLDLGADCRIADENGNTVLHHLADYCYHDTGFVQTLVRLLIDRGADLNAKNLQGRTVLRMTLNPKIADFILRQPECKPTYRKLHKDVIINKNNFRGSDVYPYCKQSGGIKSAISRIEDAVLDAYILPATAKPVASGSRDILM